MVDIIYVQESRTDRRLKMSGQILWLYVQGSAPLIRLAIAGLQSREASVSISEAARLLRLTRRKLRMSSTLRSLAASPTGVENFASATFPRFDFLSRSGSRSSLTT